MNILHVLQLRMIPARTDLGLLIARLGFGLSLLFLHGWGKLTNFSSIAPNFANPWGLGTTFTLALTVLAEFFCAGLVAIGLFTRLAALIASLNMLCAFWYGHQFRLTGQNNGELAFLFLIGFVTILIAGPGRYALDRGIGAKSA